MNDSYPIERGGQRSSPQFPVPPPTARGASDVVSTRAAHVDSAARPVFSPSPTHPDARVSLASKTVRPQQSNHERSGQKSEVQQVQFCLPSSMQQNQNRLDQS